MARSSVPADLSFHLLEEITDGFSEQRKLGSGAYGTVYMGVHKDGAKIAVKVLHDMLQLDDHKQQFQKEFNNLSRLKHQNIVQLVGYCYETRNKYIDRNGKQVFAEKRDRLLCFEYMHNGSLEEHLTDECSGLDWRTRYTIIKGICKGLKYLHEELECPMFHLDLKPANILLDENMVPKIADFGLSRLFGGGKTQTTTSVLGTVGYRPPEYRHGAVISIKFDIFSLGAVIIKIMTGRDGYYRREEIASQQFIERVHGNWRTRLQATSAHALGSYSQQVKRCIEIALSCMDSDGDKRPSIGDILNKLNWTESLIQSPEALTNSPRSSMDQESWGKSPQTDTPMEEGKQEKKEGGSETENCFGEVIDNYKLDKIARYMGKRKTQEDRAREAWNLVKEDDKDGKASRYVEDLKAIYGNGQSTLCLVYNATGEKLRHVANYDWYGHIGDRAPYPSEIGNGQWAAFHHVHQTGDPSGSVAAVVYRGKNRDGQDRDYLVAWSTPWGFWYRNKAYCEIGSVGQFQTRWGHTYDKVINSDYSAHAKSDGCDVDAKIGTGDSPKFIAKISSR